MDTGLVSIEDIVITQSEATGMKLRGLLIGAEGQQDDIGTEI